MKNSIKVRRIMCGTVLPALFLVVAVVLSMLPFGCKSSVEGIEFLEGDFSVPEIADVVVKDPYSICLEFSKPVHVNQACVSEKGEGQEKNELVRENTVTVSSELEDEGCRVIHTEINRRAAAPQYHASC